jgi:hypothetical protein
VTAHPLPRLGLCPVCEGEARIRRNGGLYAHGCVGDGREPVARLRPTFARWLHSHAGRRDDHENRITYLAQRVFVGCSDRLTPVDVLWATADELHEHVHDATPNRRRYSGQRCDWLCEDIEHTADIYAVLLAAEGVAP